MELKNKFSPEFYYYFVGFIQADGSLYENTRNRGKLVIELSMQDIEILQKIKQNINQFVNCTITERARDTNFKKDYHLCALSIHNLEFRNHFKKYMNYKNKSMNFDVPFAINDPNIRHYIRGFFDGDGSLSKTNDGFPILSICTKNEKFKDFVCSLIHQELNIIKMINRNKRDHIYNICLYKDDCKAFSTYMYQNSTIYLDRKYQRYLQNQSWERSKELRKRARPRRWTPEEEKIALSDRPLQEKCNILNRTENSVKCRIQLLKNKR